VGVHLQCPVCLELPHLLPIPVCANGHLVCQACSARSQACPVCRDPRPRASSSLAGRLVQALPHTCSFPPCGKVMALGEVEEHLASCRHRHIRCIASSNCRALVSPSTLQEHLSSGTCQFARPLLPSGRQGSQGSSAFHFTIHLQAASLEHPSRRQFTLRVLQHAGRCFCINMRKLTSTFLVLPMMIGSEEECSRYQVEVTLGHLPARFSLRRRPVSSEVAKERWGAEGVELTLATLKQFLTSRPEDQGLVRMVCSAEVSDVV